MGGGREVDDIQQGPSQGAELWGVEGAVATVGWGRVGARKAVADGAVRAAVAAPAETAVAVHT
jgi:hypothetical protein